MKFYEKHWFMWLWMVLCFPVGIFLLWKFSRYDIKVKAGVTLLWVAFVVYNGINPPTPPPAQETAAAVQTEKPDKVVKEEAPPAAKENIKDIRVCNSAGLGDLVENFEKDHKAPVTDNKTLKTYYSEDSVVAVFVDGRAVNLTFSATKNHKVNPHYAGMVPNDANLESTKTDDSDEMISRHITRGHSDKLAKTVPDSNGYFTITESFDKKTGNYLQTVVNSEAK